MFIDINKLIGFKDLKEKPKIAKVIANNDPTQKARIKVQLEGLFDPEDPSGSNLPWIRQEGSSFNGVQQFQVPDVGSLVELNWRFGSRVPTYKPAPYEANNYVTQFIDTYPYCWGWADKGGFTFRINRLSNEFVLKTKTFTLEVDSIGNFTITNPGSEISSDASGNIIINGGNINLSGTTTIEGKKFLEHTHTNGHQGGNTGGVV